MESNGISVHYFEVFKDKQYTYSGHLVKAGNPYQTNQLDVNQTLRKGLTISVKTD